MTVRRNICCSDETELDGSRLFIYTLTKDKAGDIQENHEVSFCLEHPSFFSPFLLRKSKPVNLFCNNSNLFISKTAKHISQGKIDVFFLILRLTNKK